MPEATRARLMTTLARAHLGLADAERATELLDSALALPDIAALAEQRTSAAIERLNADLVGRPSAVFVGALAYDGTLADPAPLAAYSNFAGSNRTVQAQFLVVGVDSDITGLSGTSFAAPTVAGYAAILSSKFRNATPNQLAQQLLSTARQDTINGYDVRVHGQGEASLTRALAPRAIR